MLVLNLYAEAQPQWSRTDSYYGRPWVWCQLHNLNGSLRLAGNLPHLLANRILELYSALVGAHGSPSLSAHDVATAGAPPLLALLQTSEQHLFSAWVRDATRWVDGNASYGVAYLEYDSSLVRMNVEPYTRPQVETIVRARLATTKRGVPDDTPDVIGPDGIQFACMEVSTISSDARRVLDTAARTDDVKRVMREMANSPTAADVRELAFHNWLLLADVWRWPRMWRSGIEEMRWGDVQHQHLLHVSAARRPRAVRPRRSFCSCSSRSPRRAQCSVRTGRRSRGSMRMTDAWGSTCATPFAALRVLAPARFRVRARMARARGGVTRLSQTASRTASARRREGSTGSAIGGSGASRRAVAKGLLDSAPRGNVARVPCVSSDSPCEPVWEAAVVQRVLAANTVKLRPAK
ncbi:hypothetical protein PsYK624_147100 [Phanerochaete sordida]|uniref:Alpha-N-acetylglucosaminidase tim-barrel domain-containing protein n=1 Tax=Phanerochaete sordida TaxID=48140 RepID=A0A9P3GME3_9APHY|nr:hypothetical protein PsYK624_147100 [Phanerochaete sordida]